MVYQESSWRGSMELAELCMHIEFLEEPPWAPPSFLTLNCMLSLNHPSPADLLSPAMLTENLQAFCIRPLLLSLPLITVDLWGALAKNISYIRVKNHRRVCIIMKT